MPKLTSKQVSELLQLAGVEAVEIVEDESKADTVDTDTMLAAIDNNRINIIKPKIQAELSEEATKVAVGRSAGVMTGAMLKMFGAAGVTRKELEEKDKLEDQLKICLEKHNATFDKNNEDLRNEMLKLAETKDLEKEELKKTLQAEIDTTKGKYVEKELLAWAASMVNDTNRLPGDDAMRAEDTLAYIRKHAHVHYDENTRKVSLRQKDKPEVPLLNEAGTQEVDGKHFTQEYGTKGGWITKDTRHINPAKVMNERIPNAVSAPSLDSDGLPNPVQDNISKMNAFFEQNGV